MVTSDKSELRYRLLRICKYHNPSFSEIDLEQLIKYVSIDPFLTITNRTTETALEESDSIIIQELLDNLRKN